MLKSFKQTSLFAFFTKWNKAFKINMHFIDTYYVVCKTNVYIVYVNYLGNECIVRGWH